jgi:hypothetical protein
MRGPGLSNAVRGTKVSTGVRGLQGAGIPAEGEAASDLVHRGPEVVPLGAAGYPFPLVLMVAGSPMDGEHIRPLVQRTLELLSSKGFLQHTPHAVTPQRARCSEPGDALFGQEV